MLNQVVLVGRLVSDPELYQTETGKKIARMVLAVPRSYKNSEGEYETDYISCKLWQVIAQNTVEYCKKGDLVGIRGRIETYSYDTEKLELVSGNVANSKFASLGIDNQISVISN